MAGRPGATTLRTLRVASEGEVLVQTRGEPTRRQHYSDLSLGGMFIESLFPEETGTRLKLDLQIEGTRLRLPAEVVWSRPVAMSQAAPAGMGVAFSPLNQVQKKLLYSELAAGVQRGRATKAGTPPRKPRRAKTARRGGLRGLIDRLRGD